ncbi:MAG: hypothetical protein GY795_01520 [Desulfobacterales bacterium]|nr:hypothetical protein [Desulfobacterales bacterium]
MKKANKTSTQLIIGKLMTGAPLKSSDIAEMITEKTISVKDVSSLLSKISNKKKCPLGYFIDRKQVSGIFIYNMKEDALKLSDNQAYGLTLKTGEAKYTIEQALKDYPSLAKYVDSAARKSAKKAEKPKNKPDAKKAVKKPVAKKPAKKPAPAVPAKKQTPVTVLEPVSDTDKLITDLLQKITDGNLNINLKVSVKLEK